MSYTSEIDSLARFLATQGFRAEVVPGSMPGESPRIVRKKGGDEIDPDDAPQVVAAAAHLWALLNDLKNRVISKGQFDSFGGLRCRALVKQGKLASQGPHPEVLMKALAKKLGGGQFKISQKGTPLVVVGDRSICWFGTRQIYRVFDDYGKFLPGTKQTKRDFRSEAEVLAFFEEQGVPVTR